MRRKITFEEAKELFENEKGKWDWLFVYGTLKRGQPNHYLMLNSFFIDEAITKHKYWREGFIQTYDKPIKGIISQYVEGEVYLVPLKDFVEIDMLEGHPTLYKRKKVPVILKNSKKEVKAWIYFLQRKGVIK